MAEVSKTPLRFDRASFLLGIVMIPLVATCGMAYVRAGVPQAASSEQRILMVDRDRRDAAAEALLAGEGQQETVRRQTLFVPAYAAHSRGPVAIAPILAPQNFASDFQSFHPSSALARESDVRGPPHG